MSFYTADTLARLNLVINSLGNKTQRYQIIGVRIADLVEDRVYEYKHVDGEDGFRETVFAVATPPVPGAGAPEAAEPAPEPVKAKFPPRKFDYGQALDMRNRRASFARIAEHFGVSMPSARRACKVARLERKAARKAVAK